MLYSVLMLLVVVTALAVVRWRAGGRTLTVASALGALLGVIGILGAIETAADRFDCIRLLTVLAFLHLPLFLIGLSLCLRQQKRRVAFGMLAVAGALLLVALYSFLIEPHWLQVTQLSFSSPKLRAPVRIAIIADVQTDSPGAYEERACRRALESRPDLVLFAGDYVQVTNQRAYDDTVAALNAVLRRIDWKAPLGNYAVMGNLDRSVGWPRVFAGLPVALFETTATRDLGLVALTGLTLVDSSDMQLSVKPCAKFHIVLGHAPDFALGGVDADLLIAGHTHGGQVRLPFIGPLMTFSRVPRAWAAGATEIAPGRHLVVSRGVGMERGLAPRLRFGCRPEVVIIDVTPQVSASH